MLTEPFHQVLVENAHPQDRKCSHNHSRYHTLHPLGSQFPIETEHIRCPQVYSKLSHHISLHRELQINLNEHQNNNYNLSIMNRTIALRM
jgi:hypothetical protein